MINHGGEFENNFKDIYPDELQLNKEIYRDELQFNKENSDNIEASFLGLQIKIKKGNFIVGLFDKRRKFPFSIVRVPYKSSNLQSSMFITLSTVEYLTVEHSTFTTF